MANRIEIKDQTVEYEHKVSRRVRGLRLSIFPGGRILVTTRPGATEDYIHRFIAQKSKWILAKLDYLKTIPVQDPATRKIEFAQYKTQALTLAKERVEYFSRMYNVRYGRISIKNHKTLWGSCSKKGNLNFNYKIALLPAEYADYVVVHELCHLREFNHSQAFWHLVAQAVPNHKTIRTAMRRLGLSFS